MTATHELGARFAENHPEDAARTLEHSAPQEAAAFLEEIAASSAAGVVRRMNAAHAADCLSVLAPERAAEIIANLPLDHAALLLRRMGAAAANVLDNAAEPVAQPLRRLLQYPEGTAAALTDPQVLTLPSDIRIAEAQKYLRRHAAHALFNVYVVDRDHRLVGVLNIRALLAARPSESLSSLMRTDIVSLPAHADLTTVAAQRSWLEYDALPVVDKSGILLGIIRHKTLRQLAAAAASRQPTIPAVAMAVALADLYWQGLSALLAGLMQVAAARPTGPANNERGMSDGT